MCLEVDDSTDDDGSPPPSPRAPPSPHSPHRKRRFHGNQELRRGTRQRNRPDKFTPRKRAKSYGHTDMEDVLFNPCPNCQRRILVFPKHLPSGSNSLSNTTSEAFGNDSNNGGGQELNSDGGRSKIVEQKVKEMWLADHLLDQHVAELFSAPKLREDVWYDFLLDDTIPITRKSRLLIVKFCGGASTTRQ
ncbi:hypothetical protein BVRB_3g069920 [Beta vulgaris subsp. vulgaris]|nr:hypothetical protein BVRB_3g069920 [Beta vulgaris subsp. vulgaris]